MWSARPGRRLDYDWQERRSAAYRQFSGGILVGEIYFRNINMGLAGFWAEFLCRSECGRPPANSEKCEQDSATPKVKHWPQPRARHANILLGLELCGQYTE